MRSGIGPRGMQSRTELLVGVNEVGRTVLRRTHCEVPLIVRVGESCGPTLTLLFVNGSAGPLGGDELHLSVVVENGASVRVRSVGASMVQPGTTAAASSLRTTLVVGADAAVDWELEPTVSVVGSRHRSSTLLRLAATSSLRFRETVCLGRFNEQPGTLAIHQRLVVDGAGVLDHETVFGGGALRGPGGHGHYRLHRSTVLVRDDAPVVPSARVTAGSIHGTFPVRTRIALVTSSANSLADLV